MDDLKNVGESNYNPGDGTDQRVQSLVFMIYDWFKMEFLHNHITQLDAPHKACCSKCMSMVVNVSYTFLSAEFSSYLYIAYLYGPETHMLAKLRFVRRWWQRHVLHKENHGKILILLRIGNRGPKLK